jgi:signal transduction histidine kinase
VSATRPSGRVQVLVVGVVGALATVAVAFGAGMTTDDALQVAGIGVGVALLGTIGGLLLVRGARRRSVSFQIVATALVVLVPVAVGAWLAARTMFLNEHDLGTLAVILVASATVGIATALVLGNRVGRASHQLIDVARGIGNRAQTLPPVGDDVPEELARLYDELQEAATRLREAREREQSLDSSRRELVAWVSHDLRTPLSAIRALSEALEDGIVDADSVPRYHSMLRVEAERLTGLVDDLFELSRTQAGVLRMEFEHVSLADIVSDALAAAAAAAAAKGVHLEGHLAGAAPELYASAPEMLRALRNILENAIRHTPSDGTVVVEAGADGDHAYVSVQDSGAGIPDDVLPRVFEVAFSGDTARSPGSGAGLGLAIARGLVEAHAGEVVVRNTDDGACFTIRLPLADSTPEPA